MTIGLRNVGIKVSILQESGTIDLIFTNYLKCKKDIAKKVFQ